MSGSLKHLWYAALALLLAAAPWSARADGGWVCLTQNKEPYKITVFADPAPLRAGPVDFTVLVQDLATGRPVTDIDVLLSFSPTFALDAMKDGQWLPPCCRLEANTTAGKATLGAGGNSLLYEMRNTVSQPGEWKLDISIIRKDQTVMAGGLIQVEKANPPWFVYWPYLLVPLLGLLFLVLNGLARRSGKTSGSVTVAHGADVGSPA